jgi:hypothetical protein
LLDRRPQALADPDSFTAADYRDLLAWFSLVWIDPNRLEHDPTLAALTAQGRGFIVADLRTIHAQQREIAAGVLPLYRRLQEAGQLEIVTTPYFHPILPLLVDFDSARRASPGLPLPSLNLSAPEDVAAQLKLAVEAHTRHFGTAPSGLWPSEGAVSPEILPLVTAAGCTWLATDEAILGRSLGRPFERDGNNFVTNPRGLYRPYRTMAGTELGPIVVFRDHELSDRIGFLYRHLPPAQAAEDLIYRLLQIRERLHDPDHPYLVTIILDGENCWEYYEHNGDPFLHALYGGIERRCELRAVTVSEYLEQIDPHPAGTLAKLATGSWIGGDLTTWIGDPEHNRAWEALARARGRLVSVDRGARTAWQALYAAEGSDWFWWYSRRNRSDQDALFDRTFRHNLMAVYQAMGDEPPADGSTELAEVLAGSLSADRLRPDTYGVLSCVVPAAGYCSPRLTAATFPGEAWAPAATIQPALASTGAMQRAGVPFERLFIGHDARHLYLRLDLRARLDDFDVAIYGADGTGRSVNQRLQARYAEDVQPPAGLALHWQIARWPSQETPFLYRAVGHEQWESVGPVAAAHSDKVLEVAVPFDALGLAIGSQIKLLVTLARRGIVVAQLPEREMAAFGLPAFDRAEAHLTSDGG